MRFLLATIVSCLFLAPLSVETASAQNWAKMRALMADCRADAAALCSHIRPGGGRIAACLYAQIDDLSPVCRRAVRISAAIRACSDDAARLCAHIPPGKGRIAACLSGARDKLTPRCEAVVALADRPAYDRDWGDAAEEGLLK